MSVAEARPAATRHYSKVISDQTLDLRGQAWVRTLFSNCVLERLAGARIINSTMRDSRLEPRDVRDLIGVTVTLDCHTWARLRASPLALDAILFLVTMGADEPDRERVRGVIDPGRRKLFDRIFPTLE